MHPIDPRCPARYERPGGREVGDRIVACHLPAMHPGEHEEAGTEVTWVDDAQTAERSDLPEGQQSKSLSWPEAVEISKADFEAIERQREALADREAPPTSCCAEDELATELADERALHRQAIAELATMREVAQGNKRHVAYLAEENDRLRAEVARVRAAERERVARYLERGAELKRANARDTVAPHFGDIEAMALVEAAEWCRDATVWPAEPSVGAPTPEVGTPRTPGGSAVTCPRCGLPDPYRGQGDGIGSCDCSRCECCGADPDECECSYERDEYYDDPDEPWDYLCSDSTCDHLLFRLARKAAADPILPETQEGGQP